MDENSKNNTIHVVIGALAEAANDKNESVRDAISNSLNKLARKHPNDVLENLMCFCRRNTKLSAHNLSLLLKTIQHVCQEHLSLINDDIVCHLTEFAMEEMTKNTDYTPDIQMPASGILVALGKIHCNKVMEGILKQFQPGVVPHYCILHTMGNLASANVFGIVPFIKATLGTMLPMIGMVRNDTLKQASAFLLGRLSDAVLEYLANIEKAPDPTVKKESFSTEINIAYDVLITSWINSKEPKVCESVLQALGPMFPILDIEKVLEHLPKLISTLLHLYRRNVDPYCVSQCLAALLLVVVEHNKNSLDLHTDVLLNSLFEMICPFPDYAQTTAVKNHYEVLRCFNRIATACIGRVLEFLVHQLKNGEREKIKALVVVAHLVNSSENVIQSKIKDVIVIMKNLLNESSIKVKKAVLKTVVALAYKGHLIDKTGTEFIEYIVKNSCSLAGDVIPHSDSDNEVEELSQTCANTLYLLTTTVSEVESTLWPLLLKCYLLSDYTTASTPIVRCLAHMSSNSSSEKNSPNGMDVKANYKLPNSLAVFGRSLALLGNPLQSKRGVYILNFLKNIAKMINPHLSPLWEQKIPDLILYLKECSLDLHDEVWDELILGFVSSTITEIDEEKWTLQMGEQLIEQLSWYSSYSAERGMIFKILAISTCHTTDKFYVNNSLDVIFASLRQYSSIDSKYCSKAIGIISRNHLGAVLPKLESLRKGELSRRSSRLLSFMKDAKHEGEQERIKLTLLKCYGEIALEAPSDELVPRIENDILQWVLQQINTSKEAHVTQAALSTLGKIAEGFHPNRNTLHIVMQGRSDVLNLIINQMNVDYISNSSRQYILLMTTVLKVAAAFIKLPPELTSEERISMLKHCFTKVYHIVLLDSKPNATRSDSGGNELFKSNSELAPEIEDLHSALGILVQDLLLTSVCPSTLDELFTLLEPWISQKSSHQRAAALDTLNAILHCYISNVKFGYEAPTKFSQTGLILGRIAPRCTDPDLRVRQKATDCMFLVLCLAARYEGHSKDYENDFMDQFVRVQKDLQTDDPQQLFKAVGDLAQIMCSKLPQFQVIPFTDSLLDGLMDAEPSSSSGASVILNVFLKVKGGELYHQVTEILNGILKQLSNIHNVQTRNGSIRAILALAHHHPKSVVSALLLQRLPYDLSVSECWMVLAQDPVLSSDIIEQFLSITSTTPLYDVQHDKMKIAVLLPLAAISAMSNMFSIATMQSIAVKKFSELFSMFLIAMGCYVGISPPICAPQKPGNVNKYGIVPNRGAYKIIPAKVTQDAFKAFLLCSNCEKVAEELLQCTHFDSGESLHSFLNMIPGLVRKVCVSSPQSLPRLVGCFNQYGTSNYEPQRVTVAAFFAELINMRSSVQMVLLESILSNLLNCLTDPSPMVRQLCLKGLASVSSWEQEQVNRYSECVLSALLQGLDDHENGSKIPFEAMKGFMKMLKVVDITQIEKIQVTIALRIKPFFEKEDPEIRATAICVFGDIAKYGAKLPNTSSFLEQINGNLACFFLYLNDDEELVIKACKYTLKQVCPWLETEKLNLMCQEHLHNESVLYYSTFISAISKILVEDLKDLMTLLLMNSLSYIKSPRPKIRGNAAMFIGLLCSNLSQDMRRNTPLDTLCARLLQLLKDENQEVRAKAAEALSSLFTV